MSDGEDVVIRLRPHGRVLLVPVLVLLLTMAAVGFAAARVPAGDAQPVLRGLVAVLALLVLLRGCAWPFLRWRTTTLTITDRRIRTRHGVVRSRTRDVPLWRVADVVVERSVLQRLTGTGTLLVDTTGERGGLVVRDVPRVHDVADRLGDLLDELDLRQPDDLDEREPA